MINSPRSTIPVKLRRIASGNRVTVLISARRSIVSIVLKTLVVNCAVLKRMSVVHGSVVVAIYLRGIAQTLNVDKFLAPVLGRARSGALRRCIKTLN